MEAFGVTLKRHRLNAGMSLRQLGAAARIDYSYLSQVERGVRRASRALAEDCDRAIGLGGGLVQAWQQAGEIDVHRRTVLGVMGALAAAPAVAPLVGLEALRHTLGAAAGTDTDAWERIVAGYARDFYILPAPLLRDHLQADLTVLSHQLAAAPDDRGLLRAAAHLAAIMAMGVSAAGLHGMARRWWDDARVYADRSTCLDTRLWVRDWEVVNGTYERRPVAAILDRADETVALAADRVCVGHVGVLSGRAQALAVAGRADEARRALAVTAAMTDRMPPGVVADADSMFGWPEVRLRHTESYVYTHIGDTAQAMAAQDRALDLYPAELGRERAQMLMHRASCLIQDGDVGGGLRYAADVLDDLPAADHTALLYQVARSVVAVVPERERRRAEVAGLRDRIAALPAG
ncbi:helix-turn-helix transcriptional regulator [Verrucosispora sp. WMMC514]|uniref:helix-turn-helix domain-containing protein n=1 Tax=Verrucosispora sp. WMMC514 TaxID=3015156 RepID=UPI00248B550A|nr:helix-turn-helix transcriptional regulator [Verrucosispora sp. WMMC514]WBB94160.1 helix-turn-helix transcriptional regulator [Verrucosispora sp. WMMC514]